MAIRKFRSKYGKLSFASGAVCALVDLGAPALAVVDAIVASANMKVGAYTIAGQPDVPRNITCTRAVVAAGADTPGTLVIVGTNAAGEAITETLIPGADTVLVQGAKAFKTVVSVTGVGWVIAGGNDTITVGYGPVLGLGVAALAADMMLGILGTVITAHTPVTNGTICGTTVDMSAGTYNGAKHAWIFSKV